MKLPLSLLRLSTILGLATSPAIAVPEALTFHGRITVDAVNYSGTGHFRFALVNEAGDVTYWSNDGTSVEGSMPEQAVELEVVNGFYQLILGNTDLPNMEAIPYNAFESNEVYLRVWFDDGVNGVEQLAPDQRITSVGYAMKAGSVDDGAITTSMIADGAITADKIEPYAFTAHADPEFQGTVKADRFEGDGRGLTRLPVFDYNSNGTRVHTAASMKVGGELGRPRAKLHVEAPAPAGNQPENHVMLVKNLNNGPNTNGIAVMLENDPNGAVDNSNNYVTFYYGEEKIAGRIEGMSDDNIELAMRIVRELEETYVTALGLFKFNLEVEVNEDWFDPGSFPDVTLSDGELPSITFDDGELPSAKFAPGELPSLSFNRGALPTVNFNRGSLPSLSFEDGSLPSLSFSRGSLPSLQLVPTTRLNPGSLPSATFDPGSLPSASFEDGSLPSLSFNGGRLPSASLNGGKLPNLTLDPGRLPRVTLDPGRLPTLEIAGGELPSVKDLPFELKDLSVQLDPEALARLMKEFGNDLDALKKAWRMFHDPVCAAIIQSQIAFEGAGVTYESGSGDYAEWLERIDPDEQLTAGEIVGLHGGKISKETKGADQVMVISHRPIVLGNMPRKDKELYEKVAFMGQVPVRVIGEVKKGDYIIPTGDHDGSGRAVSPDKVTIDQLSKVVGVSWADSDLEGPKYVKIIVGLRTNAYTKAMQDQQSEIESLRSEVAELKADLKNYASLNDKVDKLLAKMEGKQQGIAHIATH